MYRPFLLGGSPEEISDSPYLLGDSPREISDSPKLLGDSPKEFCRHQPAERGGENE